MGDLLMKWLSICDGEWNGYMMVYDNLTCDLVYDQWYYYEYYEMLVDDDPYIEIIYLLCDLRDEY